MSELQAHFEETVVRPLIDRLQAAGALPEGEYEVEWPDVFDLHEMEYRDPDPDKEES